jgi:hypothetical protein
VAIVVLHGFHGSASAQSKAPVVQSKDPLLGTWKQNVEKSSCIIPVTGAPCEAPPQVPTTRVFEDLGGGFLYVANDGVDSEGKPTGNRIIFKRDGKDYPIAAREQPGIITISFTTQSLKPFTSEYIIKLDGEVLSTSSEALSLDGKIYTTVTRGTNIRGQTVFNKTVFERVTTSTK